MKKNISVIILNWKKKNLTLACIASLSSQQNIAFETIVIDNHSEDDSVSAIKKRFPKTTLIKNSANLGWSGGNNVGIRYALKRGADFVILLNNDAVLGKNCIQTLILHLEKNKTTGIVNPKIYRFGEKKVIANAGSFLNKAYFLVAKGAGEKDTGQYDSLKEEELASGAVMVVKREVFESIGLFDETYYLYFEDVDFSMKAKKDGFKLQVVQNAIAYHKEAASSGMNSPLHTYYNTRNHLLFIQRCAPFSVKLSVAKQAAKTLIKYAIDPQKQNRKYELLGIRDYYLRRFGKRTYW